MTPPEHEAPSSDEIAEIRDMLECARRAKFIFWEGENPAQARRSESGVPCGTDLPPRGLIRGWEVCERCIKIPSLECALVVGLK